MKMLNRFIGLNGKVVKKYKKYLFWQCINNSICGIEAVISTHSMYGALNNADNTQNIQNSLTFNMIGKEIIGNLASLPLVNVISKMGDKKINKFVFVNVSIFELSTIVECSTSLINNCFFIPMASLGIIGKGVSFIGMGALNAKVISKIIEETDDKNNMCELHSKNSSLVTVSFSVGMIFGLALVKIIPCPQTRICLIPALGCIRYYSTIKSVEDIM